MQVREDWSAVTGGGSDGAIFRRAHVGRVLYYAPGFLAVLSPDEADDLDQSLRSGCTPGDAVAARAAAGLREAGIRAQQAWDDLFGAPFAPLALTLYLHNDCSLRCAYCYTGPTTRSQARLSAAQVRSAAELVAGACHQAGRPLTVVFHGGGEPTRYRQQVDALLDAVEAVAAARRVPVFRYIATNGVFSAPKAAWLSSRFDLVGLSCDGPDPLQGAQRPLRNGASSLPYVERTAKILRQAGRPFHLRATVTPDSLARMEEAVAYFCQVIQPEEIHLEPVYAAPQAGPLEMFSVAQAAEFASRFVRARQAAGQHGIRLTTSGARPGEIHGPYCNVLRGVLNLLPDGSATACFKRTRPVGPRDPLTIPAFSDGAAALSVQWVEPLRQSLRDNLNAACQGCFNRYHCVRDCPDGCLAEDLPQPGSFRCELQRILADAAIRDAADRAIRQNRRFVEDGDIV